ncbi:Digeranylgeranylglyceryl phosphate synthase [uncultured archaeon]|nr:Digeranylgeranylglyceryl phosphate synthase [uncultured archaeon]
MHLRIRSLKSFAELVRLEHGLMYGIGVFIGAILSGWNLAFSSALLVGFIVSVLSEFGAFALNDYFDVKADITNRRRDRPIVRKEVSPDAAILVSIASFLLANALAFFFLNSEAFSVVFLLSIVSMLYNVALKNLPLVGNLFIAITMAVPFLFGGLVIGGIGQPAVFLSAIAFFVGAGREVMKDIEDVPGDRKVGAKTLPIVIGAKWSARFAVLCYALAMFLSSVPFFTFFSQKALYAPVLFTDVMLLEVAIRLWGNQSPGILRWGRKQTLYAVAIGLASFLLASL